MSSATNGMPVQQGAVVGAVAFIAGLILTLIIGMAGLSQGLGLLVAFSPLLGTVSAFLFVHLWPVVMGGGAGSFLVWTIIPIIVLLVSGYYVGSNYDGSSSGFVAGASVTVGYLILTILGFLLLLAMGGGGSQANMGVQIGQLIVGIIFTGIIFPVVFGGIGGAIADSV